MIALGDIRVHSRKGRPYRCTTCGRTSAATHGTPPYRLKKPSEPVIVVLTLFALAAATALAAIAVLTMPVIVKTVASRHYPQLAARRGGTLAGSLRNALTALLAFAALWLATLPLLLVPPLYVAASLLLNAWLSQRMFRYDALAEHASASELNAVLRENRTRLLGLGLVLSPLSLIPVLNILVLPIYAGIAYTELCLAELAAMRARGGAVPA